MREPPADPVLTGVSAIDGLTTLVRGRSCPSSRWPDCPTWNSPPRSPQATAGGEPFCVVVAAMGLTHADAADMRDALEDRRPLANWCCFSIRPTIPLSSGS